MDGFLAVIVVTVIARSAVELGHMVLNHRRDRTRPTPDDPARILAALYAGGDISEDEFIHRQEVLAHALTPAVSRPTRLFRASPTRPDATTVTALKTLSGQLSETPAHDRPRTSERSGDLSEIKVQISDLQRVLREVD